MYQLVNFVAEADGDLSQNTSTLTSDNSGSSVVSDSTATGGSAWPTYVFLIVLLIAFVAMIVWNNKKAKKQKEEQEATLNAIRPGNKVKTVGGVCGIVVEITPEENTFVLETGSEACGKSYMKFDMQAIYDTDAKPEPKEKKEDKKEEKKEEAQAEEPTASSEKED